MRPLAGVWGWEDEAQVQDTAANVYLGGGRCRERTDIVLRNASADGRRLESRRSRKVAISAQTALRFISSAFVQESEESCHSCLVSLAAEEGRFCG